MKIAIPSHDEINVFNHFGRTPGFIIAETKNGKIISKNYILNDFTGHAREEHLQEVKHHEHKSHDRIFQAMNDVEVVIARGMGRRLYDDFQKKKISVFITTESFIDNALEQFLKGTLDNNPDKACDH